MPTPAERLRALLARPDLLVMPGCHNALWARLIEEAGAPGQGERAHVVHVARADVWQATLARRRLLRLHINDTPRSTPMLG